MQTSEKASERAKNGGKREKGETPHRLLVSPKPPRCFRAFCLGPLSLLSWNREQVSHPKMFRGGKENLEKESKLKGLYMVVGVKFSFEPFSGLINSPPGFETDIEKNDRYDPRLGSN